MNRFLDLRQPKFITKLPLSIKEWPWLLISAIALTGLTALAPIKCVTGDSLGCLLTSQAVIHHGTVRLDGYRDFLQRHKAVYDYQIIEENDHIFYYFPIGTSFLSVPFVALANAAGLDMREMAHKTPIWDGALQIALSAMSVSACLVLIYMMCRCMFPVVHSAVLSAALVLGGPLISTMGSALWSHNFEVFFILLCLLMIICDYHHVFKMNGGLLALFSFIAYVCRPTAAIFIALMMVYAFAKNRAAFIKMTGASIILFGGFVLFSMHEYGQVLPPYYLPQRIGASNTFWTALYGNLLSPARGLLVYSPFLIMILPGVFVCRKTLFKDKIFWLCALWFVLHLISVSSFPHWWGGHSFGPRLLIDAFPALVMMTLIIWRQVLDHKPQSIQKIIASAFICLSVLAVFINTYQGLYNTATFNWNRSPNIDQNPEYLFDWNYPQFLATEKRQEERMAWHRQRLEAEPAK